MQNIDEDLQLVTNNVKKNEVRVTKAHAIQKQVIQFNNIFTKIMLLFQVIPKFGKLKIPEKMGLAMKYIYVKPMPETARNGSVDVYLLSTDGTHGYRKTVKISEIMPAHPPDKKRTLDQHEQEYGERLATALITETNACKSGMKSFILQHCSESRRKISCKCSSAVPCSKKCRCKQFKMECTNRCYCSQRELPCCNPCKCIFLYILYIVMISSFVQLT